MKYVFLSGLLLISLNNAMESVELPSFNITKIKNARDLNRATKVARFLGGFVFGAGSNFIIDNIGTANLIGVSSTAGSTYAFNGYIKEVVREYGLNESQVFDEAGWDVFFGYLLGLGCGKFVRHCLNSAVRSLKNKDSARKEEE